MNKEVLDRSIRRLPFAGKWFVVIPDTVGKMLYVGDLYVYMEDRFILYRTMDKHLETEINKLINKNGKEEE